MENLSGMNPFWAAIAYFVPLGAMIGCTAWALWKKVR